MPSTQWVLAIVYKYFQSPEDSVVSMAHALNIHTNSHKLEGKDSALILSQGSEEGLALTW